MKIKTRYFLPAVIAPMMMACTNAYNAGVVVEKKETGHERSLYVDTNGDNLVDYKLIMQCARSKKFYEYAATGDSIVFKKTLALESVMDDALDIKSINNRTYNEVVELQKLNGIRAEIDQQKVR